MTIHFFFFMIYISQTIVYDIYIQKENNMFTNMVQGRIITWDRFDISHEDDMPDIILQPGIDYIEATQ